MTTALSRRGALGAGAVALGAAAVAAAGPAQAQPTGPGRAATASAAGDGGGAFDPAIPVRSQFLGREGVVYDGASQWSAHRLVLTHLGDLPGGGDPEHRFAVRFASDEAARDGLYRLTAAGEPDALLYLVRAGGADPLLEGIVDRRSV
ncbi:hypothetical protein ROT00_08740 [Agromyces mediolanus]|uniref:hypothetical protein n=1 Tax=Agromyces mediolanus TaxID=41986 RepID=UPI003835491C